MSIKISELPQATSVGSSDIVPIVQGGTTKQASLEDMKTQICAITGTNSAKFILSASSTYQAIPMTLTEQVGSLFSINSSGNIVVNSNVSMAFMSFKAPVESTSTGVKYIRIAKNSTILSINFSTINTNTKMMISVPMFLISNLQANDVIKVEMYGVANDFISVSNGIFNIMAINPFPALTSTLSLNLMRGENTGSLVGLGDKSEVTDETLEKTKLDEVTEVKEAEAKTEEIEKEGSGDER